MSCFLKCMYCGAFDSKVLDSRPTEEGSAIRRRRECVVCGRRFTTYEKIESVPLMVIKRSGNSQLYDIEKVRTGILKACEKCRVSAEQIETLVQDVDKKIHADYEYEITSLQIGEIISDGLRVLDPVAYIRFSSVYKELNDLNKLMEEMNKLISKD